MELHLFFGRIMKEHALFICGMLDPTEGALIQSANDFAGDSGGMIWVRSCSSKNISEKGRQTTIFKLIGVPPSQFSPKFASVSALQRLFRIHFRGMI
ncbi:MAG: DUF2935 domain-containing protein [Anaerovoracaceae bacterium]|nr:DUF2935 domain-containing protein [Anaerovoracaceae bacterium]